MLIFWEERNILPQDVMHKMRSHVASGVRSTHSAIQAFPVPSLKDIQPMKNISSVVCNNINNSFSNRFTQSQTRTVNTISLNVNLNNQTPPIMSNHTSFIESKIIPNEKLILEQFPPDFISSFICEKPCLVNLNRARDVCSDIQINLKSDSFASSEIKLLTDKLTQLIENALIRPPLPQILFGKFYYF